MSQFIQKVDNGYIAWGEPTWFGIILTIVFFLVIFAIGNNKDSNTNTVTSKTKCIELLTDVNVRISMEIKKDNIAYVAPKGTKFCDYENINNWIKIDSNRYISNNVAKKLIESEKGE